jgi:N-acetylglutamate synthase-like GNAT family acetyltransferase
VQNTATILTYVKATPEDSVPLSETAIQSKKYWGYSDELIRSWMPELEITKTYIEKDTVVKIFQESVFIGFFGLSRVDEQTIALDHLWLVPEYIQKGFGKVIFEQIRQEAQAQHYKTITIISDPNANGFYEKMGGKEIERIPSSIPNRYLIKYSLKLPV